MNLELLESFGQNYPEEYDNVLDCVSVAVACAFNKHGTLLAVGCNDGRVVVWDFMTRGIAKVMTAHSHPVASVSWSRNGRKVLTACTDNTVCIMDVLTGDCETRYRFPSPVLRVQFPPKDQPHFLVCPMRHAALLVEPLGTHKNIPLDDNHEDLHIVASFDRRGKYVFSGDLKGKVLIHTVTNLELVASFRLGQGASNSTAIKSIDFSRRGDCFLLNSADRIIRVYDVAQVLEAGIDGDAEPTQRLQDLVNRTMWKKCCFSGDSEYVCAGSARQHAIYIWEKSSGNLVKILHGTKGEFLLDVVWHPIRPIIASISSGVVSIWSQNQVENWSAFAPDFKELDENVEYEERESEFDLEDEDKITEAQGLAADDDLEVDVVGVQPIAGLWSSDDEDEADYLMFLPIAPDIEDTEEQWAPPPDPLNPVDESQKRSYVDTNKENHPSKKRKVRTYDVYLENAPVDEVHPLLSHKPQKDKSSSSKKGRPSDNKKKDRYK